MDENKEFEVSPERPRSSVKWIMIGVIVLIVVCGGIVAFSGNSPSLVWGGILRVVTNSTPAESKTVVPSADSFSPRAGMRTLEGGTYVTYVYFTGNAFVPSEVTINAGEKVRFVDVTNLTMRVGSRPESLSSNYYSTLTEAYAKGKGSTYDALLSQSGIWSYENLSSSKPRVLGVVYVR